MEQVKGEKKEREACSRMSPRSKWLLNLSFAALCGVLGYNCLSTLRPPPPPQDAGKIADEGESIVRAVQKYKGEIGLWPERLEDLKPHYLSSLPTGWQYTWLPESTGWRLMHRTANGHFVRAEPYMTCWAVGGGRGQHNLDDHPIPKFQLLSTGDSQVLERTLTEFERRCAREPANCWHWKGMISLLIRTDRRENAIGACDLSAASLPQDWWPRAIRAKLLLESRGATDAIDEYAEWCDSHPRFAHYWYLSLLWRQAGYSEAALNALARASEHPLTDNDGNTHVASFICYDAAAFAYINNHPDLVLALCRRWPALYVNGNGACVDAMRALALLSLGDADGAARAAQKVVDGGGRPDWVNDFGSIQRAVERRDFSYRHRALDQPIAELGDFLVDYK